MGFGIFLLFIVGGLCLSVAIVSLVAHFCRKL